VRLTGSVKTAENYMKSFEKEMEIKMHCFYKEEAGVQEYHSNVQSTCQEWSCILDSWGSFIVSRADVSSLIRSKSD